MDSVSSEDWPKKRPRSKMRSDDENIEDKSPLLQSDMDDKESPEPDDRWNIALLLFLYLLQGIPLGLSAAIPIILTNRKIDYKDQVSSLIFHSFIL